MSAAPAPGTPPSPGSRIAVVGLACRFPDADDPAALLDVVLTGRRAFRRIPRCRLDLADYYNPDPAVRDATFSTRAALLEGWRFDAAAFGVPGPALASAGPAHWLALETAARALAAAGFAGGAGLPENAGACIGAGLSGDGSPAAALRLRWPYSRRVIAEGLRAAAVPADLAGRVLEAAAARYAAPFPAVTGDTLAGSTPAGIASGICRRFGLRGGGATVDAGGASSLAAIASACLALAAGELDVAVAGGVDLRIDVLDLVGLAKAGMLATGDMRVYDEHPTGFLPGEGCGIVLLMRSADARAAGLPVYAEIIGWGTASDAAPESSGPCADRHLLAMRRAHAMAGVDPADVQLIEGSGTGLPSCDRAELAALAELRAGSRSVAALGSISANIGHARAAAGAAGLIKSVLAIANGVLPPSAGVRTPHPIVRDGRAALSLPGAPQPWPAGTRHAGVSASGPDGIAAYLVVRGDAGRAAATISATPPPRARSLRRAVQPRPPAPARSRRQAGASAKTAPRTQHVTEPAVRLAATRSPGAYAYGPEHPFAYLLRAADQTAMTAVLSRIAEIAPWLADGELQDLATGLSRTAGRAGTAGTAGTATRVALTAAGQDELAGLAREAIRMLRGLRGPALRTRPGIYASQPAPGDAAGSASSGVALVISDQPGDLPDLRLPDPAQRRLSRMLAVLRWLEDLGVAASAAVGHGLGEVAGLVWAGSATPEDARTLTALRSAALAAPPDTAPGQLSSAIGQFSGFAFRPPRRRLISGSTGRDVAEVPAIAEVLCAELFEARLAAAGEHGQRTDSGESPLAAAIAAASAGARLLLVTGPGQNLAAVITAANARAGREARTGFVLPSVAIEGDPADDSKVAHAAAALFAAGALARPEALYAGRPSRPFDLWREQVFLTHPCEEPVRGADVRPGDAGPDVAGQAEPPGAAAARPRTATSREPAQTAGASAPQPVGPVPGVGPWVRCFAERTRPARPRPLESAAEDQPWRVHTGGCEPLRQTAVELFRHDPGASRTLALIGHLDDPRARAAAVTAARDAIGTGTLVAITPGPGPAGLWATLRAEHPAVGITVVRAPLTADGLGAARRVAAAEPGEYRELTIGPDGTVAEPVLAVMPVIGGGEFPLGPQDVVLISRGSGAAGLVLAQVIACSGAAVAVMGRDHPEHDGAVIAGLEELRRAGAKICYELIDLADHAALAPAVRRVEARFGRVTAIGHSAGPVPRLALTDLTPGQADEQVRRNTDPLDQLAAAVRTAARGSADRSARLRLIITSGSVIGRYGMAGEAAGALVTGAIADLAQRIAAAGPACRALHVDWPAFSGGGLGERADLAERMSRAGFAPLPVAEGSRQLLKLLASDGLPARIAVHGRVGVPAPRPIEAAAPAAGAVAGALAIAQTSGRFVERVLAHYPGVELVAEAGLSLLADPYLGDYRVDGVPVLPPAMALEAMAQAASELTGAPARQATDVRMSAPIVLPAGTPGARTLIRIAALRDADTVTVVVRSDNSGFAVEHCRGVFTATARPAEPGAVVASPESVVPSTADASSGADDPACAAGEPGPAADGAFGTELYGTVLFQSGRFRRLAMGRLGGLPGSRAAIALADGADELPWFGAVPRARAAARRPLVLGSAGLSDATLQLVQACVPHRMLVFEGCDQVTFSGRDPDGLVTIRAVSSGVAGSVPMPRQAADHGAQPEARDAGARWDVDATDSAGHVLIAWKGLRMRDAGPTPTAAATASGEAGTARSVPATAAARPAAAAAAATRPT